MTTTESNPQDGASFPDEGARQDTRLSSPQWLCVFSSVVVAVVAPLSVFVYTLGLAYRDARLVGLPILTVLLGYSLFLLLMFTRKNRLDHGIVFVAALAFGSIAVFGLIARTSVLTCEREAFRSVMLSRYAFDDPTLSEPNGLSKWLSEMDIDATNPNSTRDGVNAAIEFTTCDGGYRIEIEAHVGELDLIDGWTARANPTSKLPEHAARFFFTSHMAGRWRKEVLSYTVDGSIPDENSPKLSGRW